MSSNPQRQPAVQRPSPPNQSSSIPSFSSRIRDRYIAPLRALSARTGTPLPSLLTSFAILHELTAIVPFVGIFYACKISGFGESATRSALRYVEKRRKQDADSLVVRWVDDGERWAERVGRRYGVFGYVKRSKDDIGEGKECASVGMSALAGDGANALVAYCLTKARFLLYS